MERGEESWLSCKRALLRPDEVSRTNGVGMLGNVTGQCFICGGRPTFQPSSGLDVCRACALRVADLAAGPPEPIWTTIATPDRPASATPEAVEKDDADQVFEAFKEGVAQQIAKDDADSHLNLAEAYSEMGLLVDARREAAVAITAGSTTRTTIAALRLLLTPPLLPDGALNRLRERLLRPVN